MSQAISTAPPTPSPEAPRPRAAKRSAASALYAIVWRWHFYAGLFTAPVLWVVTITGALYVFRTELVELRDRHLLTVAPAGERLSYAELHRRAGEHLGGAKIDAISVRDDPGRSVAFVADAPGAASAHGRHAHQYLYLNPYSGAVLGSRQDGDFFDIVLQLHRNLMMGSTGRFLGELATCWGLILLGTGAYLWWPRGKKNVGVWVPKVKGNLYSVLRDWHAVVGAYLLPLTAIVAGTGLFFALILGSTFNKSVQTIGHWAPTWFSKTLSAPAAPGTPPASLDDVVAAFLEVTPPGYQAPIQFPETPEEAFTSYLIRDADKNSMIKVGVDQYTAERVLVAPPPSLPLGYRVRLWAVSIHMGQIFGMTTKVLALVATLVMFALSVTGVWMWWKRRPRGRTGAPRRPPAGGLPAWGWALAVLAGVLMPAAGLSMILVVALDLATLPLRNRFARTPA